MIRVPIVFRGPNGAAAGVTAQHSQVESRVNLIKAMTSSRYPPPPLIISTTFFSAILMFRWFDFFVSQCFAAWYAHVPVRG